MKIHSKITTFVGILAGIGIPVVAFAGFGLGETAGAAGLTGYGSSIPAILGTIIGSVLSLIGIVFFILVVYGGFMWMTAGGNQENVKKAINTVVSAAIGLVVVLAAYAITTFALGAIGGSSVSGGGRGGATTPSTSDESAPPGATTPDEGCTEASCSPNFCYEGSCVSSLPLGATCAAPGDCTSGVCESGSCVEAPTLGGPGEACSTSDECVNSCVIPPGSPFGLCN